MDFSAAEAVVSDLEAAAELVLTPSSAPSS
jgi:hypothetical protein